MKPSQLFNWILGICVVGALLAASFSISRWLEEARVLRKIVDRLSAETRVAEVLVTKSEFDESTRKILTTIKFLEYAVDGHPVEPKYFTFQGNVIQFQSLVIRFDDDLVKMGDRLKGKSAFLFMKAFVLDGEKTQVFDLTEAEEVPGGYRVDDEPSEIERQMWARFWEYALDPEPRKKSGIKNAQIEAPGSMFVPGTIYTLRIEHDGGLRIDAQPIPEILKGEKI